jgi:hypothetical protein
MPRVAKIRVISLLDYQKSFEEEREILYIVGIIRKLVRFQLFSFKLFWDVKRYFWFKASVVA